MTQNDKQFHILITSDLHFDDTELNSYRFKIFNFLELVIKKYSVKRLFILGDLTDKKDKHSSTLVNNIVYGLNRLSELCEIYILTGNHDYIEYSEPYFLFLNNFPKIFFISQVETVEDEHFGKILMIPHRRSPKQLKSIGNFFMPKSRIGLVVMHQTVTGSITSNGTRIDGIDVEQFENIPVPIVSGDIHVPQVVGNVKYVGSPYAINYGDTFIPRVLLMSLWREIEVYPNIISKKLVTIESVNDLEVMISKSRILIMNENISDPTGLINSECRVKIRFQIQKRDLSEWSIYKQKILTLCDDNNINLRGLELVVIGEENMSDIDKEVILCLPDRDKTFDLFCEHGNVGSDLKKIGKNLLNV